MQASKNVRMLTRNMRLETKIKIEFWRRRFSVWTTVAGPFYITVYFLYILGRTGPQHDQSIYKYGASITLKMSWSTHNLFDYFTR